MGPSTDPVDANFAAWIDAAWHGRLELVPLLDAANALTEQGRAPLAAVLYRTWLDRTRTPHEHLVQFNLGVLLFALGDVAGAQAAYSRALLLAPGFLQPRFNLGLTYERLGQGSAAVAQWQWITQHADPEHPEQRPLVLLALNNLGRHHEDQGRLHDAVDALTRSLRMDPNQPDVVHHLVFLRAKQCQWPVYEPLPGLPEATQRAQTSAMAMIALSDDPAEQLEAARSYVRHKLRLDVPRLAPERPYPAGPGHERIRIGYCSGDFCMHPVAMLTVELFELHDRSRFEVFGFDWSREDGSSLRQRVIGAMDHFERIHALDDEQAARLIREREIDILVDLQGQTLGARANLLAWRPAPVQVTYLGLPATTGLPFIDHVIADRYLIPDSERPFYSEEPLYLPDIYQSSDRQRQASEPPSRAACGLPEHAFVFCSFNNNYKTTPEMFDAWMHILRRTPGSVLWLLADNPWAEANLRREAMARGIAGERLVFAPRAAPADYLARYRLADLFLDSYPFNAGTTANDALWMGCPVLTRSGRTFASRMAGALLTAAGLPELITTDVRGYVERAVQLASTPGACAALRQRLEQVRESGVLFDTPRFVRALEQQFARLAGRA
ncbi:MAG: tetratricopeptide repeat protein [Rubrivivax sp.]|nr:tetratricopeptide repeat protein [Rubrivivax sp.]